MAGNALGTNVGGAGTSVGVHHHANATKYAEPWRPGSQCPRRTRGGLPIDEVIRRSWSRCLTTYALDPYQSKRPNTVEHADLQARRQRIGAVLPIARIEMEGLSKLMLHSEYSIMLTDRDGVILSYVGDAGFAATARRCGFREGVVWSEQELGTNGMGTCLTMRRPIVIHRAEHFLAQNIQLTCSAAPIFDMRGQLLAALDISGASANAQTHTLALVDMAAQNVENRALLVPARTTTCCASTAARNSSAPRVRAWSPSTSRARSRARTAVRWSC